MAGTEPDKHPACPRHAGRAGVNVRVRKRACGGERAEAGSIAPFNTRVVAALIDVVVATGLQIAAMWILPDFAE